MAEMKHLTVSYAPVTDVGLENLKGMERLRTLDLISTHVTGSGLRHLESMASLTCVNLDNNPVTDDGALHLGRAIVCWNTWIFQEPESPTPALSIWRGWASSQSGSFIDFDHGCWP